MIQSGQLVGNLGHLEIPSLFAWRVCETCMGPGSSPSRVCETCTHASSSSRIERQLEHEPVRCTPAPLRAHFRWNEAYLAKIFQAAGKARVRRSLRAHDRLRSTPAISRAAVVVYTCESGDHQSNDRLSHCVLVPRSGTRGNVAKWQSDHFSTA